MRAAVQHSYYIKLTVSNSRMNLDMNLEIYSVNYFMNH